MLHRKLAVPVALAVATLASACGSGASKAPPRSHPAAPATFKSPHDLLISRQDILRQKSPAAAAIFRWWQALQYQDVSTAASAYTGKVRRQAVETDIRQLASFLTSAKPQVEETEVSGARARILTIIQWVAFKPSGVKVVELPVTFSLTRKHGRWKLDDNSFLNSRLQLLRQAGKPSTK